MGESYLIRRNDSPIFKISISVTGRDVMQYGIYYAYWEHEWKGDYRHYIEKVAKLGFDILEIAVGPVLEYSDKQIKELKACAQHNGIRLTGGYGPTPDHNIASEDAEIRKKAVKFYIELFRKMEMLNITLLGGALYSYWPVDYSKSIDKKGDWERGVEGTAKLGKIAAQYGIETLGMECLNRFENHILNTAKEGVAFVKSVHELEAEANNVKVMLDTFHMNIEEQNIGEAIRTAGKLLGHFHTGECNRMVPGEGRMPWIEIRDALKDVSYKGTVVMEPFVMPGGQIGKDIKVWRNVTDDISERALDSSARRALEFQKKLFESSQGLK